MTDITHVIENAAPVIAYYGYWPSFHDAKVIDVQIDCRDDFIITVQFVTNDSINDDRGSHLAEVTMRWHDAEEFKIDAFSSPTNSDHWINGMSFERQADWITTEFIPMDNIGGTIRARQVEVTHFAPIQAK